MPSSPRRRRAAISFILVVALLDVIAMGIVIPILPALIEEFTGSASKAGWVNGIFLALWAIMQFIFSPIVGSLSDRFGRRPILLLSSAGLGAAYVLMALAPSLGWLALARIVSGITASSIGATLSYMADITPPPERSRAYGWVGAAFAAGFVLGPVLGGLLGEVSPRLPFWAAAGLSFTVFAYGLFILPESLDPSRRMAFSWRRANPLGALRLLGSHPDLVRLSLIYFFIYFAHHVFTSVFVLYAGHRYGWGTRDVGLLLAFAGLLDAFMQGVVVGRVVPRLGERRTMVLGLAGGTVGLALMGLAPTGPWFILAQFPSSLWELSMPTLHSLMTQRVSESEQGQLQGANTSVASIAGIFSPLFFGAVYAASVGEGALIPFEGTPFLVAAGVLAVSAILGGRVAVPVPVSGSGVR